MSIDKLARHYDALRPWERFPAILAASARGDDSEAERLAGSAPRISRRCADYLPLGMAFREVCELHYMDLLRLAALYYESRWLGTTTLPGYGEAMRARATNAAALFDVQLRGWRMFCQRNGFPAEWYWNAFPGQWSVRLMEAIVDHDAELIRACAVDTAPDTVAAELQGLVQQREVHWNGGTKP